MFALSLRVGLRPGEAAALWWEDIDGHVLNVRRGRQAMGAALRRLHRHGLVEFRERAAVVGTSGVAPDVPAVRAAQLSPYTARIRAAPEQAGGPPPGRPCGGAAGAGRLSTIDR